jgi:hypothetical protein
MTPLVLNKMAEELQRELLPPEHPAKTLAKGIGGFGLGYGAGYLGLKGLDHLVGPVTPSAARQFLPFATGVAGMATPFLMQAMLNKMRSDHLARQEQKKNDQDR